jgi:hypothetical protein
MLSSAAHLCASTRGSSYFRLAFAPRRPSDADDATWPGVLRFGP